MSDPLTVDACWKRWASPRQQQLIDAILDTGSLTAACAKIGMDKSNGSKAIAAVRVRAASAGYAPEHDMTKTVPEPFVVKGTSTLYDREGKPKLQWVKTSLDQALAARHMRDAVDALSEEIPRVDPLEPPAHTLAHLATLYTITDFHLGMMAWHKEGGADWDLRIAERVLIGALEQLAGGAPRARLGIVNVGGDFLHSDGLIPVTPMHGHVLDQDGRFSKIVATAIRCIRRLVDIALMRHETVELLIQEGNHDLAGSLWLRHMFGALYENEPRVRVNTSELPYYAIQHGKVMLGFHHGHLKKNDQLPMLFAAQFPQMWGETTRRYAHCGHRHHVEEKEHSGMTVIQHPTLVARDAYAARGGWIADRAASAITYHAEYGQVGRNTVTPEMLDGADMRAA